MPWRIEFQDADKLSGYFDLPASGAAVIGRGTEAVLRIESGKFISRRHAEVKLEGGKLRVRRLPEAANPVFHAGAPKDEFLLEPGEIFVIGQIRFRFVAETAEAPAPAPDTTPADERVMPTDEVYAVSDRMRLKDLLELPEILRGKERNDFYTHIAGMLRLAAGASWAAVVNRDRQILGRDTARDDAGIKLSHSLMNKALAEQPKPIFHSWRRQGKFQATMAEGVDWAVCAAVEMSGGEPIFFYVAGNGGSAEADAPANLDNTRYVGLVADIIGRSLSVQKLEEWETRLQRFFSGAVVEKILRSRDMKELEPRITECTVMFFDIRGFSKLSERNNETLLEYQGELKQVISSMTEEIFEEEGVVLQYTGDGIMACWNAPMAHADHVDRACRAALNMARRMAETLHKPLEGESGVWRCGIGIHTGEVVAGAIGSEQVFSYGIIGAVVNQASRVEGITKQLDAPVLITREVAAKLSAGAGIAQRLGRFQPAGMKTPVDLYELLPPPRSDKEREALQWRQEILDSGLAAFEKGGFEAAYRLFHQLPVEDAPAQRLLFLAAEYRKKPPRDWQGIVELAQK